MKYNHAFAETPKTSLAWNELPQHKKEFELSVFLRGFRHDLILTGVRDDGHVIVSLAREMSAAERGELLMDAELYLKENVDVGLTIWLDPKEDKSKLRHLRGIEIKSWD